MKQFILVIGLILTFTAAKSQSAETPTPQQKAHTQALKMQRTLSLSDDQTVKAEAVILNKIQKIVAISADGSKTADVQNNEIEVVKQAAEKDLQGIFTSDQYALYQHKKEAARARAESAH